MKAPRQSTSDIRRLSSGSLPVPGIVVPAAKGRRSIPEYWGDSDAVYIRADIFMRDMLDFGADQSRVYSRLAPALDGTATVEISPEEINSLWWEPLPVSRYIPKVVRRAVIERDGNKCVFCDSSENIEIDHIKPFSLGGSNTVKNLQCLCFTCNSIKSNDYGDKEDGR